jgi:hypothetical protein
VAGQYAVADAAAVQGESHVGTPIVDREYLAIVIEYGDGMTTAGYNDAATLLELVQGADPNESLHRRCHYYAS